MDSLQELVRTKTSVPTRRRSFCTKAVTENIEAAAKEIAVPDAITSDCNINKGDTEPVLESATLPDTADTPRNSPAGLILYVVVDVGGWDTGACSAIPRLSSNTENVETDDMDLENPASEASERTGRIEYSEHPASERLTAGGDV
jgi:hypothetical protein